MELDLLQVFGGMGVGFVIGVLAMLLFNKVKSGSASAVGVKNDFDEYKNQVEAHFEATSKKFQNMTEQYQDLYQHLSVGATSLCRSDSVAAALVDDSNPAKPAQLEVGTTQERGAAKEPTVEKPQPHSDQKKKSDIKEPQTAVADSKQAIESKIEPKLNKAADEKTTEKANVEGAKLTS